MQYPEPFWTIATRERFQKRPENYLYHSFKSINLQTFIFQKAFSWGFFFKYWKFFRMVCLFTETWVPQCSSFLRLFQCFVQERIHNPTKHLRWSFLPRQLTAESRNYIWKSLHLICLTRFWIRVFYIPICL